MKRGNLLYCGKKVTQISMLQPTPLRQEDSGLNLCLVVVKSPDGEIKPDSDMMRMCVVTLHAMRGNPPSWEASVSSTVSTIAVCNSPSPQEPKTLSRASMPLFVLHRQLANRIERDLTIWLNEILAVFNMQQLISLFYSRALVLLEDQIQSVAARRVTDQVLDLVSS
ncbi:hypothetical protein RRG08_020117 [Elysia crispata]|uniref:Uncharacterized protein n=1 Tax=Elysia crispata TaxID=231223 RepID=A0AAE1A4K8_9GAST|nr:hypothetical protein RRG08_020117 [Elysia crispata]